MVHYFGKVLGHSDWESSSGGNRANFVFLACITINCPIFKVGTSMTRRAAKKLVFASLGAFGA